MRCLGAMSSDRRRQQHVSARVGRIAVFFTACAVATGPAPALAQETAATATGGTAQDAVGGGNAVAEIMGLLDRGEALFNSADQPDSINIFSEVILRADALTSDPNVLPALARGLSLRAQAQFNLGQEVDADSDLRRLLRVAPRTRLDPTLVSPKLIELFDGLRAEIVGEVALTLYPETASVYVDGLEVETTLEPIALAEGIHTLSVELLGHATHQRDIEIAAGDMLAIDVVLERSSAIVIVRTAAPGASVTVDGRAVGETAIGGPGDATASDTAILRFDGVGVGTHVI